MTYSNVNKARAILEHPGRLKLLSMSLQGYCNLVQNLEVNASLF